MAFLEIKGALSLSYGAIDVQSPKPTPAPYFAGIPAAVADFERNMPPLTITPSAVVLSAEGEAHHLLGRFDLGARVGARLPNSTTTGSIWSIDSSLFAQYRINASANFSVPLRLLLGAEHFSGEAFSLPEASKQSLSGTVWKAGASVGIESIAFQEYPVSLSLEGYVAPSDADLGHGYNVRTGAYGMAVFSIGKLFSDRSPSSLKATSVAPPPAAVAELPRAASPEPTDAEKCAAAASGVTLEDGALSTAVAKCAGSALPVFEAMDKKLGGFILPASDVAKQDEFRLALKQFAEGITSAVKASKLTAEEAIPLMKKLAGYYDSLLKDTFAGKATPKAKLELAVVAMLYPFIPLLKANPADGELKRMADGILKATLKYAMADGKAYLPNILEALADKGAGSSWLKSHKKDLLAAAAKIKSATIRKPIETSLKKTFK